VLDGGDGDDFLEGGFADDVMMGGAGNDLYFVDNVDDATIEDAGEGDNDQVMSTISWTLDDNVEMLQLTGGSNPMDGNLSGTGNALANTLVGNGFDNTLDGKGGADLMFGGFGNDTYIVNNAGDQVIEAGAAEGFDTVLSSVSRTLGPNVENLVLTGSNAINGTGNTDNNGITGNGADNALNGSDGNDTLTGLNGHDALTGGTGADGFVYSGTLAAANSDTVADFVHGSDHLDLDNNVLTALAVGDLAATRFKSATDITGTGGATVDPSDRILYDSDSGKVFYDPDGNGAAGRTLIFTLTPNTVLSANDIHIFGTA